MKTWLVLSACLLSACAGGGGTSVTTAPRVVHVDESANGTQVQLRVGDHLDVALAGTYWQLAAPTGKVLTPGPLPSSSPQPPCRPVGSGCGSTAADYVATTAGTATVQATRVSCGEALRCTPDKSHWALTVTVER
ncbi:MAG: hypothetical protein WCD35_10475 [Mycobacteriales bacterium]